MERGVAMKKLFFLCLLLLIPINTVLAADRSIIKCDKTVFKEYAEFICRVSVQSSFAFDKIEFAVEHTDGLYLVDVRSNFDALWKLDTKGNAITATIKRNQIVDGLQEFGILLVQSVHPGKQELEIVNMVLSNSDNGKTQKIDDIKQEINILSSENKLKGIFIDTKVIPRFDSQIMVYRVEIGKNQSTLDLAAIALDSSASIKGIGSVELDLAVNEFVLPVQVTSASGTNRVYLVYLTRAGATLNNHIVAKNIVIKDNNKKEIDFKFNPHVYEYNIEVDNNITYLDISILLDDGGFSLVKGFGSQKVTVEDGDNVVLIKIKDLDNNIKTYVLNVMRVLSNKSSNCLLKSLNAEGYNIRFSKRVKQYNLAIKPGETQLILNAITDHPKAEVTIIGNESLKENSVIKIVVTAENGSKFTYQITITYQAFNYSSIIVIALVLAFSGVIYGRHRRKVARIKAAEKLAEELRLAEVARVAEEKRKLAEKRRAEAREKAEERRKTEERRKAKEKRRAEERERLEKELSATAIIKVRKTDNKKPEVPPKRVTKKQQPKKHQGPTQVPKKSAQKQSGKKKNKKTTNHSNKVKNKKTT